MENDIKKLFGEIEIPSELDSKVQIGIENAEKEQNENSHFISNQSIRKKKLIYATSAAILLFSVFISLTFISPTMANVASKIPYLGRIFELKSIGSTVSEELENEGYKVGQISIQYKPEPLISIPLKGTEDYLKQSKNNVTQIVQDSLAARGYDNFKIKIYREQEVVQPSPNNSSKESSLIKDIYKKAEEQGLKILMFQVRPDEKVLTVEIPKEEERLKELEDIILSTALTYGMEDYNVKFRKIDIEKQHQIHEWDSVISLLSEALIGNSDYKVKEISYSNSKDIFNIIITSSLNSSNSEDKKSAQDVQQMVQDLIQSEINNGKIQKQSYEIVIQNVNGERIN